MPWGPADCRSPPICNLQSAICKLQRAPRRAMVVATSRRPTLCWRTLKAVRTTCSNEAQKQPSVGMRIRSAASFMTITGSTTVAELITSDVCRVAPVERLHDMHVVSSTSCILQIATCSLQGHATASRPHGHATRRLSPGGRAQCPRHGAACCC